MPSFACCAMQCAYALLMVHQKTKTVYMYSRGGDGGQQQQQQLLQQPQQQPQQPPQGPGGGTSPLVVNSLLMRLQQGLTSIYGTLANYATAFEALGGMRGEFINIFLQRLIFFYYTNECSSFKLECSAYFFLQTKFEAQSRTRQRLRSDVGSHLSSLDERHSEKRGRRKRKRGFGNFLNRSVGRAIFDLSFEAFCKRRLESFSGFDSYLERIVYSILFLVYVSLLSCRGLLFPARNRI